MVADNFESDYKFTFAANRTEFLVCYNPTKFNLTQWKPEPTTFTLPTLYIQIAIMMISSGVVSILLKPLYQQRLTAALLAGILMGPTFLTRNPKVVDLIFPFSSLPALTMFKNLGIIFYMFLAGLEMNLTPIVRIHRKTLSIALAGMVIPFGFGFGSYFILRSSSNDGVSTKLKSAFPWAIALTSTNLPNLTQTLSDLKLLRTDIGRMALSSAFVSEIGTWFFLILLIISTHEQALQVAILTAIFFALCIFGIRPALFWLVSLASSNKLDKEEHVHFVIFGVMLFALVADSLGLTAVVGAFVFGFILPSGRLTTRVTEQLGAITNWISIPLYCLDNGLKTKMDSEGQNKVPHLGTFLAVCWLAKFMSTMIVSLVSRMNPREAIALSVLMNSKGLLPIIIINFAKDQLYFLSIEASSAMVVAIFLMMVSVPLMVKIVYKPHRRLLSHSLRTVDSIGSDWPLRIIAGVHTISNVQAVMDLVQISTPTQRSPIYVTVAHLVELTDETSAAAMLIVHDNYRSRHRKSTQANVKAQSEQIVEAVEDYQRLENKHVAVECLTNLSPYRTMHEDICSIAEDKYATVLVLPFDIQSDEEETKTVHYSGMRNMYQNLLASPPCTIALLINRGMGTYASSSSYSASQVRRFIMFFIGGLDDREALTYVWRMASDPQVQLTVVRINEGKDLADPTLLLAGEDKDDSQGILNLLVDHERQKESDEEFISEFRYRTIHDPSVRYLDETSNNGDETINIIRNMMGQEMFELCVVGKGDQHISPLTSGLSDLVEFPEIGAVADSIVTSNFSSHTSVLVIQRYIDKAGLRPKTTKD